MQNKENEYKDFSLFNDIEDSTLRNRNRGVIMRNITQMGRTIDGKVKPEALQDVLGYMLAVPANERKEVLANYIEHCQADGLNMSIGG